MAGISHHLRVAACALTAVIVVGCTEAPPPPPPVSLTVDGTPREVEPGTTFGELIHELELNAKSGRLLSVGGSVLDARRDPGIILLNGALRVRSTPLSPGDAVTVADGTDTTEGTKRMVNELAGMHPEVPQRTLATYPMKQIDVVGRISGEVVSTEFRPIGKGKVPGQVALTFDDGPWPVQTRQVLKILRRYHAKATFFMVGDLVERYPGIVRDVKRAGMPIGDHSWSHPIDPPFAKLRPHRLAAEVIDTAMELRSAGVKPYLFRPPGGSYDDDVLREARQAGMRTVTWDVDPSDYLTSRTKKELATYVLRHVRPGSIVLMHDGGGDQHATIGALPMIIKGIRKMGLRLTTIPRDH
jgi:peptidoglycan/xylan/chitin deacetylase (PgdA/CDA1 family)/sulfur carrier protein ThiS